MTGSNPTLGRFDMTGRRAMVTGAAGLLGQQFVHALVDVGARVVALDLNRDSLDDAFGQLCGDRPDQPIQPATCDVTDPEQVSAVVEQLAAEGSLDALVASAAIDPKVDDSGGIAGATPLTRYPLDAWALSLNVNLTGTFLVAQAVARVMESQDGGRGRGAIVTIASTYGLTGPDQRLYLDDDGEQTSFKPIDYPTTKAGIIGFTRALAAYYRETGIRVNALTPGGAFNGQDPGFVERYGDRTIMGRMAEPDEYRAAIAFLCSDASSYMTGANLVIDGGWSAL